MPDAADLINLDRRMMAGAIFAAGYALAAGWFIGFLTRDWRARKRAIITVASSPAVRFCRDCCWAAARPSGFWGRTKNFEHAKCMHPSSMRSTGDFLATGRYSPDNAHYCAVMRSVPGNGQCGQVGVHWQARPIAQIAVEMP
jgi:hypothetical protein